MIKREPVNVIIDAFLIYLDDYYHREGTRIEVKWTMGGIENRALSKIEFDDRVGVLKTWREALFGNTPTTGGVIMDQPLMLASVNQYVFDVINEAVVSFMTIKIDEAVVTKYVERKNRLAGIVTKYVERKKR